MLQPKIFLIVLWMMFGYYAQAQIDSIRFGSGGGFSGEQKIYKVYKKHLFKVQGSSYTCSKLTRKDKQYIFDKGQEIISSKVQFQKPFNTYKFIEIYAKGLSSVMVWGDPSFELPIPIQEYFDRLIKIANTSKFNSK